MRGKRDVVVEAVRRRTLLALWGCLLFPWLLSSCCGLRMRLALIAILRFPAK